MNSKKYDLVVVGAGIVGLAHAWLATKSGLSVIVIDRDPRCVGASIRNFGFITVTGQRDGDTWRRARRARDLWQEIAEQAKIPICHQGLTLVAQRPEALAVLEAFKETHMGEDCVLLTQDEVAKACSVVRTESCVGGMYSPHELRVESRDAIPQIASWLAHSYQVDFLFNREVLDFALPQIQTSAGTLQAERIVLCPGTELNGVAKRYLQEFQLSLTQLQMLRVRPPANFKLDSAVMSDLSFVRYAGYTGLGCHQALLKRLESEAPESLAAGIHLIVVQSDDGSLVVGDSHHPATPYEPYAIESVDQLILKHLEETLLLTHYDVSHRWTGRYPVGPNDQDALILSPEDNVRVVSVTSGTGASTAFGLAEEVMQSWGI
jgi:D-hydroxyproline dehydrogenase subunit beta